MRNWRVPQFLFNMCFSDECTFFRNETVNCHNCRYWSNPRVFSGVAYTATVQIRYIGWHFRWSAIFFYLVIGLAKCINNYWKTWIILPWLILLKTITNMMKIIRFFNRTVLLRLIISCLSVFWPIFSPSLNWEQRQHWMAFLVSIFVSTGFFVGTPKKLNQWKTTHAFGRSIVWTLKIISFIIWLTEKWVTS